MLGWPPDTLYGATVPELMLALQGWKRANGYAVDNAPTVMTRERLNEILERYT
ncbi:hypothetical protein [Kordiimonas sp. SCSIO 12610]|uniref:hypothetical protein n=1 Tax=Kordiimonas sp. SCSIO 12610 TaxID=2829597 RepID=UPI00210E4EC0|nr:hypothetical protein [Kordiimonas sp. SCSIO 12610]UTW56191.1 hypothetical protein KFF44_04645 [Kordiimonas sp. SCSIO 12610]